VEWGTPNGPGLMETIAAELLACGVLQRNL
jgi:hypothetical protein